MAKCSRSKERAHSHHPFDNCYDPLVALVRRKVSTKKRMNANSADAYGGSNAHLMCVPVATYPSAVQSARDNSLRPDYAPG